MRVEVLYVAECPSHGAAVQLLQDVLAAEGVAAEIREVLVTDDGMAKELRFCGSPTIRIDGRDIAPDSEREHNFAIGCRLYRGSRQVGVPPLGMIQRAVREARQGDER